MSAEALVEPSPQPRDVALDFWRWWHTDPYSDQKVTDPHGSITLTLAGRFDLTPAEALVVTQNALEEYIGGNL